MSFEKPGLVLRHGGRIVLLAGTLLTIFAAEIANANLVISSSASRAIACSAGVCKPKKADAVLNVTELQSMLASSSVTIESRSLAFDIVVATPFAWNSVNSLTLDSYHSILVRSAVSDAGAGGLALLTNDGGTGGVLAFGRHGNVTFSSTANALTINGAPYTLVNSIASLASAVGANEAGDYALANNYDASGDGTYTQAPIPSSDQNPYVGAFEGLGNTISHLTIIDPTEYDGAALFNVLRYGGGAVNDVRLTDVNITAASNAGAAGLVALSTGSLFGDEVSGNIAVGSGDAGGLVAANEGTIENSHSAGKVKSSGSSSLGGLAGTGGLGIIDNSYSTASVTGGSSTSAGGLVGSIDLGTVTNSFATGAVRGAATTSAGGLIGQATDESVVFNSYATGPVKAGDQSNVGGLIGFNTVDISYSYSIGAVSAGAQSSVGGFIGLDESNGNHLDCYWDTTTSGTDQGTGGGNNPNIVGLTTTQFQSGLPTGFLPIVWGEKSNINGGFPYLLSNVPRKK